MADDAPTPTTASTPNLRNYVADFTLADTPDAAHIADLLATLEHIPRDELPDGAARNDLGHVIRAGLIDNIYRPLGADYYNIAWAHFPAWEDPRQRLSEWLDEWVVCAEATDDGEVCDDHTK